MRPTAFGSVCLLAAFGAACGSTVASNPDGGAAPAALRHPAAAATACSGAATTAARGIAPVRPSGIAVPVGFTIETIAQVPDARELAALPNGDLLVGTGGDQVYIVPDAEAAPSKRAGAPRVFATLNDSYADGVAFAAERCEILFGTNGAVWKTAYKTGDLAAEGVVRIARVRTGGIPPSSDGDVHTTTSVVYAQGLVYASVGSSCNACTEIDPTRASVLTMQATGSGLTKRATRIRNAIAVFVDPGSGAVWVGGAGQDDLPFRHPYEYLDDLSAHAGIADYGWPECEENHHAYTAGADCARTVEPIVELPAYSTIIGAAFYPLDQSGAYAFPKRYRGGIFATAHGSWHTTPAGGAAAASQVVFIPMHGDEPASPVDWSSPYTQWRRFVAGFQKRGLGRRGRPTGVAVGAQGSLFVADDQNGLVYRIRP